MRRPALKKGGSKSANAASRRRVFRIIRIMLIIGLFCPVFFAIAEKISRKLTFMLLCGTRTRLRECDLVCEITVQSLPLHPR